PHDRHPPDEGGGGDEEAQPVPDVGGEQQVHRAHEDDDTHHRGADAAELRIPCDASEDVQHGQGSSVVAVVPTSLPWVPVLPPVPAPDSLSAESSSSASPVRLAS